MLPVVLFSRRSIGALQTDEVPDRLSLEAIKRWLEMGINLWVPWRFSVVSQLAKAAISSSDQM
jgi:hypothetical protein